MNEKAQIDIMAVAKRILERKWLFVKVSILTVVLSSLLILTVPRYYKCNVALAPEIGVPGTGSNLSNIASSFGLSLGNNFNGDALSPDLYPELIQSNDFVFRLLNCRITTKDGSVSTTYYKYLKDYQKKNLLAKPFGWVKGLFAKEKSDVARARINPFRLTENEDRIFEKIKDNICCDINLKTGMINISVEDQDPLVAATMADSVRNELQRTITRYRTSKASRDLEYYGKLTLQAKTSYEKARRLYGSYSDANMDILLESFNSKKEDLENDMQLKFNTYTALNSQLQAARAKVQETTPAFTVVKSATVPLKPAGPKRMAFVLIMLVLSFFGTTIYVSSDLFAKLFSPNDQP